MGRLEEVRESGREAAASSAYLSLSRRAAAAARDLDRGHAAAGGRRRALRLAPRRFVPDPHELLAEVREALQALPEAVAGARQALDPIEASEEGEVALRQSGASQGEGAGDISSTGTEVKQGEDTATTTNRREGGGCAHSVRSTPSCPS